MAMKNNSIGTNIENNRDLGNRVINRNIVGVFILSSITIIILFIESIFIILAGIKNGVFKKEVLTKKSNLGFDLIIRRQA